VATEKELLERRANVWSQMTEVIELAEREGRDLTAEERAKYDAAEVDLEAISTDVERVKRHSQHAATMAKVETDPIVNPGNSTERSEDDPEKGYRAAFGKWMRGGTSNLAAEERALLHRGLTDDKEVRAQASGTNSAGGYLVPLAYRNEFIKRMLAFGNVQAVAQVIDTDTGANLSWPTMDDTSNVGAILAENTQLSEQDLTIGTASLDAYMYTSKLTRVSYQLLQDAAFDVEGLVRDAHAERIARITNQHFTTGTGSSQPNGIVTSATSGVTAASTTAITADELIDLVHSVNPAYRASARAQFMLNDTALKALRKLKDSTGQYLWQPGLNSGVQSSLFGYSYVINQDMAVPATGVKSVLFGDFYAGYLVRIVRALQVIRFDERYADYLQVGFTSFMRADGEVQNAQAYRALTQA
jgi:HK97 family phage major capsid protein